jgi:hypothetical protein
MAAIDPGMSAVAENTDSSWPPIATAMLLQQLPKRIRLNPNVRTFIAIP